MARPSPAGGGGRPSRPPPPPHPARGPLCPSFSTPSCDLAWTRLEGGDGTLRVCWRGWVRAGLPGAWGSSRGKTGAPSAWSRLAKPPSWAQCPWALLRCARAAGLFATCPRGLEEGARRPQAPNPGVGGAEPLQRLRESSSWPLPSLCLLLTGLLPRCVSLTRPSAFHLLQGCPSLDLGPSLSPR